MKKQRFSNKGDALILLINVLAFLLSPVDWIAGS